MEDLVGKAEREMFLVDGYVDQSTLAMRMRSLVNDSEYFAFLDVHAQRWKSYPVRDRYGTSAATAPQHASDALASRKRGDFR